MAGDLDNASAIWGNLLTSSQMKELGLNKDNAELQQQTKRQKRKESTKRSPPTSDKSNTNELIQCMVKLLLRHEDTLHVLLQEHEFVLHLSPGEGSIIPLLLQQSQQWQQTKPQMSLRHTLATTLMETVIERLDKLQQAPVTTQLFQDCVQCHIVNEDRNMPFLYWCPKAQKLLPSKDKSLEIKEVLHTLNGIQRILKEDSEATLRFHSMTKMQTAAPDKALPFLWTVRSRSNGEIWHLLHSSCFHSIWQLVRLTMRPQTQQRSGLAKQVLKLL